MCARDRYIYIYIEKERERETEKERKRERESKLFHTFQREELFFSKNLLQSLLYL